MRVQMLAHQQMGVLSLLSLPTYTPTGVELRWPRLPLAPIQKNVILSSDLREDPVSWRIWQIQESLSFTDQLEVS